MFDYLFFSILGSLSGSILYITSMDVIKIRLLKTQKYVTPITFKTLLNLGLILGFILGYLRVYYKEAIITYLLK